MKKISLKGSVWLFLFVIFLSVAQKTQAQTTDTPAPDSVLTAPNAPINVSFGVPNYPDNLYASWQVSEAGGSHTFVSSTTPYTILSITVIDVVGNTQQIHCGSTYLFGTREMYATEFNGAGTYTYNGQWHCTSDLVMDDSGGNDGYIAVQYLPYDTRTSSLMQINWAQPVIIAGFFMALFAMFQMISLFKKRI